MRDYSQLPNYSLYRDGDGVVVEVITSDERHLAARFDGEYALDEANRWVSEVCR